VASMLAVLVVLVVLAVTVVIVMVGESSLPLHLELTNMQALCDLQKTLVPTNAGWINIADPGLLGSMQAAVDRSYRHLQASILQGALLHQGDRCPQVCCLVE